MKIHSLTLAMFAALALGTTGCDTGLGSIIDRDGDGVGDAEDADDDNDGVDDDQDADDDNDGVDDDKDEEDMDDVDDDGVDDDEDDDDGATSPTAGKRTRGATSDVHCRLLFSNHNSARRSRQSTAECWRIDDDDDNDVDRDSDERGG